jgi:hypothetical protein
MDKYSKNDRDNKDQKIKVDKKESNQHEKNDKNDKVDRPPKWSKNKHSFVVAGNNNKKYLNLKTLFLRYNILC